MTTLVFEIRAAALYRILGNVHTVMPDHDDTSMRNELLKEKDAAQYKSLLYSMIYQMLHDSALAVFPTLDCVVLSEMMLYIARYYNRHSEVASKISTMCLGHQVASIMVGEECLSPVEPNRSTARTREMALLNKKFHEFGKLVANRADVTVFTEFFNIHDHIFHPDSQFIRVTVTV